MASDQNKKWLPEGSGVNPKPIITFLVILTIATVFVYVFTKGLLWGFDKVDQLTANAPVTKVETGKRKFPAEPRLQGAPEPDDKFVNEGKPSLLPLDDMREYQKMMAAAESSYGWVEGKEGTEAHIPLEEAKKLIIQRGLPLKSEAVTQEVAEAEKVRKQINNSDASAGRLIGR